MDILINKPIAYHDLQQFLKQYSPSNAFFLLYEGVNEWDDVPAQTDIFQYSTTDGDGFVYGVSLFNAQSNRSIYLERLARSLAKAFNCSALCDASRLLLESKNPHYALLFEAEQVYLAQDYEVEATGQVQKIIALNYSLPDS